MIVCAVLYISAEHPELTREYINQGIVVEEITILAYGHDNGDKVLRALGGLLNEYASEDFIVGRFGGEEFVAIFKGKDKEKYESILDDMRVKFSEYAFDFMDTRLSFSSGLVICL